MGRTSPRASGAVAHDLRSEPPAGARGRPERRARGRSSCRYFYLSLHPHVLVVDGCEACVEEVAAFIDGILSSTESTVLATSGEPIGLAGESIIRIDGLSVDRAVDLFRQRADLDVDSAEPALSKVRALCEALDGIPLAVELLAARSRSIPLDRLADRIGSQISLLRRRRSLDDRHGSLSAALDWSYDLLSSDEKAVLRAVSVYRTPFTGATRSVVLEIRWANSIGCNHDVLTLAREWFDAPVGDPIANDESEVVDRDLTIYGSVTEPPCIFAILFPVASALECLGRVRESAAIAGSVPALMATSRFAFWDQFREFERWESLRSRLGHVADEPLTLPGVYEAVREMVG